MLAPLPQNLAPPCRLAPGVLFFSSTSHARSGSLSPWGHESVLSGARLRAANAQSESGEDRGQRSDARALASAKRAPARKPGGAGMLYFL
jgi:hypothetical protein